SRAPVLVTHQDRIARPVGEGNLDALFDPRRHALLLVIRSRECTVLRGGRRRNGPRARLRSALAGVAGTARRAGDPAAAAVERVAGDVDARVGALHLTLLAHALAGDARRAEAAGDVACAAVQVVGREVRAAPRAARQTHAA